MSLINEAESLLLYQFEHSKKLKNLTRALVLPFEKADIELKKLHHGRYIHEAHGSTLDIIGQIVDFPRKGMSDEDYRVWLKVAILLNNGQGTAFSIFGILQILFGEKPKIQIDEYEPNIVMFTFFEYPKFPTKILFSIIRKAVPIATKCEFVDASFSMNLNENTINALSISENLPPFQLDVTGFDVCAFADFFKEEFN